MEHRPRVEFGTAGIRGPVGDGPGELNVAVIAQVGEGLALYLLKRKRLREPLQPGSATQTPHDSGVSVVVGRDARRGSAEFLEVLIDRLCHFGLTVHTFDGPVPTPLVASAQRRLQTDAAVMITASHNPASDNGIKIYGADGVLLASPDDEQLAAAINEVASSENSAAALASSATSVPPLPGKVIQLGDSLGSHWVVQEYLDSALSLCGPTSGDKMKVATTSLHGVGGDLLDRLLTAAGVEHVDVASQRLPDPEFPTVPFPNPEEPGVLNAVIDLAVSEGCDVAIANDPDADRLAVAVRTRSTPTGIGEAGIGEVGIGEVGATNGIGEPTFRVLTGDEIGAILAHHLLRTSAEHADRLVATTLVSSRLVPAMAVAAGARSVVTPTGFKWLCRAAIDLPGTTQLLAYEEALGYAVGPHARDKDGITAALMIIRAFEQLCSEHRAKADPSGPDSPLGDAVDALCTELARQHGAYATANGSVQLTESSGSVFSRLSSIDAVADRRIMICDEPASGVLRWMLDDNTRIILRASGTEPKFKYYCEALVPMDGDLDPVTAKSMAQLRATESASAVRTILAN